MKRLNRQIEEAFRAKNSELNLAENNLPTAKGANLLQNLALQIERGNINAGEKLRFTTGMGVDCSRGDFAIRMPALLIPALELMKKIRELGIFGTRYEVFTASEFLAEHYGINNDELKSVVDSRMAYMRRFVDLIYPDLQDDVEFIAGDEKYPETRLVIDEVAKKISSIIDFGSEEVESADRKKIIDIMDKLKICAAKYDVANSHFKYAAANMVYSDSFNQYQVFNDKDKVSVMFGGMAERNFFQMNALMPGMRPEISLIVPVGGRPVYYPRPDLGDIVEVEDFAKSFVDDFAGIADRQIRSDLTILKKVGVNPDNINHLVYG